ncbi:hypothetical protein F4677DRAFT_96680 [Hypoxylon crocopeplum]|nr:hypothetical protein F4677DRAFT_96680 [Hypoxylon crocopeplum]
MHDPQPIRRKIDSRIVFVWKPCNWLSSYRSPRRHCASVHDSTAEFPDSDCICMGLSWWSVYPSSMTPGVHSGPRAISKSFSMPFVSLRADIGNSESGPALSYPSAQWTELASSTYYRKSDKLSATKLHDLLRIRPDWFIAGFAEAFASLVLELDRVSSLRPGCKPGCKHHMETPHSVVKERKRLRKKERERERKVTLGVGLLDFTPHSIPLQRRHSGPPNIASSLDCYWINLLLCIIFHLVLCWMHLPI